MGWGSRCREAALACALAVAVLGCESESGAIIEITSETPLPDDAHLIIAVGLEITVDPGNPRAHFFDPGAAEFSVDRDLTIDAFRYFITPDSIGSGDEEQEVAPFPVAAAVVTADYSQVLAMGTSSDLVRFADGEVREYALVMRPTAGTFTGCLGGEDYVIEVGEEPCVCVDGSPDCQEPPICLPNNEYFLPLSGDTVSYEACDLVPDSDCNIDTAHHRSTVCYQQANGECRVGVTSCAEQDGPSPCAVPDNGDLVSEEDHGIFGRNICTDWDSCAGAADQVACTHKSLGGSQGATIDQLVCRPRFSAMGASCGDSFDLTSLFPADDPMNCEVFAFVGFGVEWTGWSIILNGLAGPDRVATSQVGCPGTVEFTEPFNAADYGTHTERLLSVNGDTNASGIRSGFVRVVILPEQVASCDGPPTITCEFAQ